MEQQPRRRRRPALACIECRRRKVKCDRNDPCTRCVAVETPCTYRPGRSHAAARPQIERDNLQSLASSPWASGPRPLGHAHWSGATRTVDERDEQQSDPPAALNSTLGQNDASNTVTSDHDQSINRVQDSGVHLADLMRRVQKLEQSSGSTPTAGLAGPGLDMLQCMPEPRESDVLLNKTRILNWSYWMGTGEEFAPIMKCYAEACGHGRAASSQNPETNATIIQIGDLLRRCKGIARSIKLRRPTGCISCQELCLSPPSRELADRMVTLYFQSFESAHRILHIPTFRDEYQQFWNDPIDVATDLRLKVLLVIGIGSSLADPADVDGGFRNMVYQWVYAAQAWLSGPLKKDRLEISGIQVHCLSILARQIFSVGGDLVWMSMGSLTHRAMQMGLHRDPKHFPAMSVLRAELQRRLWATILEMLLQSSLDSAMPPRISLDEFDTEAPSNINDDDMDESTLVLLPHPKAVYTTTSIQLLLLDSFPARLRILRLLNNLGIGISYVEVLALSSEITEASHNSTKFLKKNEKSGITAFHRNMLQLLLRRFMIPLHCPFTNKAKSNPLFYYSLKVSLDTAMSIISPEPDESFSRLMTIGGGMFREGSRLAGTAISLELISQVEAHRLDGTLHRKSQYRQFLRQAMRGLTVSSLERIRQGETNVKSHMFLSMISAHAEAIEAGSSSELSIARSAKDSLELCHGLLREYAATSGSLHSNDAAPTSTSPESWQEAYGFDLDFEFSFLDAGFPS